MELCSRAANIIDVQCMRAMPTFCYPGAYGNPAPDAVESAKWGDFVFLDGRFLPTALTFNVSHLGPLLLFAVVNTLRVVADTAATVEASSSILNGRLMSRTFFATLKGSLFSSAIAGVVSGVCGYLPLATLSQTSSTIALTRTSCPRVGYMACLWLLIMGVVPKIGAAVGAIPNCIFGGLLAFLFGGQVVSGLRLAMLERVDSHRGRVVLAVGLAAGLGSAIVPAWATAQLGAGLVSLGVSGSMAEAFVLLLSTPYSIGTVAACTAHVYLPYEDDDESPLLHEESAALPNDGDNAQSSKHMDAEEVSTVREVDVKVEMNALAAHTQTEATATSAAAVQVGGDDAETGGGVLRAEARQTAADPNLDGTDNTKADPSAASGRDAVPRVHNVYPSTPPDVTVRACLRVCMYDSSSTLCGVFDKHTCSICVLPYNSRNSNF